MNYFLNLIGAWLIAKAAQEFGGDFAAANFSVNFWGAFIGFVLHDILKEIKDN